MTSMTKRTRLPRKAAALVKTEEVPSSVPDAVVSSSSNNKRPRKETSSSLSAVKPDVAISSTKKRKKTTQNLSPQEQLRPTPEECLHATVELGTLHPEVLDRNNERRDGGGETNDIMEKTILDGVIGTILSQNTTSANSTRAFDKLKKAFPTWDLVEALPDPSRLEETIRSAGLAKIKSGRIHAMLQTIKKEQDGVVSLEYLREYSDDDVKTELSRFKGMGPKTISCVMLFAMRRPEFPVDTHVHRICQQILGWVGSTASREQAYDHLNATVPAALKLDLHCLLIAHGKQCHRCAARGKPQFPPKDGSKLVCPLVNSKKKKSGVVLASSSVKKMVAVKTEEK